ncbi:type VI secretion protein [Streptomyces sp. TP-A0874]|uniref:type VI secretion protein n=1 Tax=Streptomyces sp. TP-A0874 TaxID=549819 RepID=UPI0009A076E5|nr:type VI secretion protein [Streptomyces sp. TP-A0874]
MAVSSGRTPHSPSPSSPTGGGIPDGLLIGILGFLLALTVLVWTAAELSALLAHGAFPSGVAFTRTPLAIRHLLSEPHDLPAAWPTADPAALPGYGLFWGVFISQFLVLTVLSIFVLGTLSRWRAQRRLRRKEAAGSAAAESVQADVPPPVQSPPPAPSEHRVPVGPPQVSLPSPTPVAEDWSDDPKTPEAAVSSPTGTTTAGLHRTPPEPGPHGLHFTGHDRETYRELALRTALEAEGALLVVTADPAVWAESRAPRAKLGPVHLYDPNHLVDTPDRLRWSPSTGCESRDIAAARATALLAPVRPSHALDAMTAECAETLLRCWLHAAAIDGRPFRQVHRWASGNSPEEPVRTLRTHPRAAAGSAGELEGMLTAHPQRRAAAQELTARALSALSSVHIRDACTARRADSLAVESFIAEGGTLYAVGEAIEDPRTRAGAMPLLTALISSVVEHGRRMAARSSSGRLDPPLTLVLDDIAAVAPLPQLPELIRAGSTEGLPTLALVRSQEQARARWPRQSLG